MSSFFGLVKYFIIIHRFMVIFTYSIYIITFFPILLHLNYNNPLTSCATCKFVLDPSLNDLIASIQLTKSLNISDHSFINDDSNVYSITHTKHYFWHQF